MVAVAQSIDGIVGGDIVIPANAGIQILDPGSSPNAVDLRVSVYQSRHPGEGRGPEKTKRTWIPAFAGMTRPGPRRKPGFQTRALRLKSTALGSSPG
jgi:hypothetical protein